MDNIEIRQKAPTVEQFLSFRQAAGWHVPSADAVEEGLRNTRYSVCVEADGEVIGMGRVLGDGVLYFYIQDVIVMPEYQKKGVGTRLMDAIMAHIDKCAKPTAYIALFSAKGMEPFYSKYGFIERPCDNLGPGMAFIKK